MDFHASFQISAAGLRVEKMRADITALNIANMNTTRGVGGGLYQPLKVVASTGPDAGFAAALADAAQAQGLPGLPQAEVVAVPAAPRRVLDPGHPHADAMGYVQYPGVDHLGEMVTLVAAQRAYEANLVALSAARTMAAKALEIGGA